MADPLKLQAFTRQSIRAAIAKLPNVAAWEVAMRRALTQAHTTAHLIGLSERLRVPLDSALLSRTRLSRAERADIQSAARLPEGLQRGVAGYVGRGDRGACGSV
jgi:hypothetical protein